MMSLKTIASISYKTIVLDSIVYPLGNMKRALSVMEDHPSPSKFSPNRFAIFGLGNPGKEYQHTRHNIGFDSIQTLAKKYNVTLTENKYECLYGIWKSGGKEVILAQPQTFMNRSGYSVRYISETMNILPSNIVVVYDEVNLDVGEMRLKQSGGSGGQKGLEDIIKKLGKQKSKEFIRVKVGIGRPSNGDLARYVLERFKVKERDDVQKSIDTVTKCIENLITEGVDKTMSMFNKSREQYEQEMKEQNDPVLKRQREERKLWWLEQQAKKQSETKQVTNESSGSKNDEQNKITDQDSEPRAEKKQKTDSD